MQLGLIGLGKMGGNMNLRLLRGGHATVVYNLTPEPLQAAADAGATIAESVKVLVQKLAVPRAVWIMVPSGDPTESVVQELTTLLDAGDTIIDGGNSNYKDTMRRAELVHAHGIHYVDVGTSGGVWGLKEGYSMMIGGEKDVVERLSPIFETLAPAAGSRLGLRWT